MSGNAAQPPFETEASYFTPEIQDALVQLVQAQDYVRQILENADLPHGTENVEPNRSSLDSR